MENELLQIKDEALEKIEACSSLKELNDIRVLYLGKKGPIQEAMKSMKNMDPDQRKTFGQTSNKVKQELSKAEEAATKYYLTKLREQIIYENPDNIAAIVMETITGSNGVIIPPKGYLPGVRKICDEFGILMICDEVMAGWGRTGKMFAFENFDVQPDIVTFAKGVTCGYVQLGGCVVSKDIAAYFDDHVLSCGLTYSAHPLACAAGCACVDYYIDNNILDNVNKVGKVLGEKLEEEKANFKCVGDVRYIGLFSAIELVRSKETKEPLVPFGKDPEGIMKKIIVANALLVHL